MGGDGKVNSTTSNNTLIAFYTIFTVFGILNDDIYYILNVNGEWDVREA